MLTATEEAVHKLVAIPVMVRQPKYVHSVLPPSRKIVISKKLMQLAELPKMIRIRTPANGERKKKKKDVSDGYHSEPRSWIFQANNALYDIESSVQTLPQMTWFVKQHIQKVKKGDKVYIWVSGKDGVYEDILLFI